MGKQFETAKNEWKNETEERENSLVEFLKNNSKANSKERPRYDAISDLHFSGTNSFVFDKISEGTAKVGRIDVFFVNNKIEQIHVVFDGENNGHNIDVYLNKKALEDYLVGLGEK